MLRIGFAILWLSFVIYAFAFAPPNQPDTFELITQLSSGQWEGINPTIVALFNLMGIWPMIYACLVLIDGADQNIPAWPFVLSSFAVGAFALLPYLALRQPHTTFTGSKSTLLSLVDSPWVGRLLAAGSIALLGYGLLEGDWSNFIAQWQTSRFINVMSLDFCLLCAVVAPLVKDDMAKRKINSPIIFGIATLIPLLGIVFYLSVRPPLITTDSTTATASS
ncbi:DUF2834 domain-containing protein [Leptolyngbya sp. BC1307]|uniref:DUF2834 domain-containing protein n=1 Tax=Leptolyngbya sp. BC1307 TaxID=2029589 RepID=UPI000EFD35CB|nr:DUF2834 domain-containing protein [Leptolyngbya sp. BC1307]